MRHFRQTRGQTPIKHSSTLVDNTGAGVGSLFSHLIFGTESARGTSGGVQNLKNFINTEEQVEVGDIIKYVNICLQCSPRAVEPTNVLDNAGWLEWCVFWQRETDKSVGVANIGILTVGCIASHQFRENCLLTGCFPIGTRQAMAQDIKIKIPRRCCKIKLGDKLRVTCYIRTSNSADMRTDSHRMIASSHFKAYS